MSFTQKLFAAFALFSLLAAGASAQGVWTPRNSGTLNALNGVAWTGTQFVAVGRSPDTATRATVLTSPDGSTWTARTPSTNNGLNAVVWTGTQLVAVGYTGTIVTSPDGITWTTRVSGTTQSLSAIAWNGTQLVAVGGNNAIVTSPDGVTWTARTSPNTTAILKGIAWSGTKFVIVGVSGYLLTSPDGITWTRQTDLSGNLSAVVWAGTQFVTAGESGVPGSLPATIYTSPDGMTWTNRNSDGTAGGKGTYYALVWTGSLLVGVGQGGQIRTSADGATWAVQASGTTANLYAIAFSTNTFAAVGYVANGGSTQVTILTSVLGSVTGIRNPAEAARAPQISTQLPGTVRGYRADGRKPELSGALQTP